VVLVKEGNNTTLNRKELGFQGNMDVKVDERWTEKQNPA
jgi:hypothetical protein